MDEFLWNLQWKSLWFAEFLTKANIVSKVGQNKLGKYFRGKWKVSKNLEGGNNAASWRD